MFVDEQLAYLTKGCVDVVRAGELKAKLERFANGGPPLIVKVGFDPTAPDLHLGHTVLIRKMKHFQDLGHRVIYVVGSFTALIGDPTGRSKTRPPLTQDEIDRNAETYKTQIFKILDPARTEVRFNSEWLEPLVAIERCRQGLISLPPPTWTTLSMLSRFQSVEEVFAWARQKPIPRVQPRFERHGEQTLLFYPGDPMYPRVDGFDATETRFVLENRRWRPITPDS